MYHDEMTASAAPTTGSPKDRHELAVGDTWQLDDIYRSTAEWEAGCGALEAGVKRLAAQRGTLASGAAALVAAFQERDAVGQLAYRVYYFAALTYDQDQRDNGANGRRQRVQHLLAQWGQATAWFNPELLAIPLEHRPGLDGGSRTRWRSIASRSRICYRQQAHVLDEAGERLLALSAQFGNSPRRRLRRARHRGREVPDDHALDR